jgi:hypothetical protein
MIVLRTLACSLTPSHNGRVTSPLLRLFCGGITVGAEISAHKGLCILGQSWSIRSRRTLTTRVNAILLIQQIVTRQADRGPTSTLAGL